MKSLKISAAVAMVLGAASAGASTAPSTFNDILFTAGATATDRTMLEVFLDSTSGRGICANFVDASGNITDASGNATTADVADVFVTSSTFDVTAPGNYALRCTTESVTKGSVTLSAGQHVEFRKYSGGSETGIEPVYTGTATYHVSGIVQTIYYADPTSGACTLGGTVAPDTTNTRIGYRYYVNCAKFTPNGNGTDASGNLYAPQGGIADVNAGLFGYTTGASTVTESPAIVQAFTVAVNTKFYKALQHLQGLDALTDASGNLICVGTDASGNTGMPIIADQQAKCMPSLQIAAVRSLLAGGFADASKFYRTDASGNATQIAAPTSTTFTVCSRGKTSGTRASIEATMFGQRCSPVNPNVVMGSQTTSKDASGNACNDIGCAFSTSLIASAGLGKASFFHGAGTGDVENCLKAVDASGNYGIGIMSSDRVPNDGSKPFRYIKIDDATPTVESLIAGTWNYSTENVVLDQGSSSPAASGSGYLNPAAPTNNNGIMWSIFKALAIDPTFVPKTHYAWAYGHGGIAVRPQTGVAPATTDTQPSRAVAAMVRGGATVGVNDCTAATNASAAYPIKN